MIAGLIGCCFPSDKDKIIKNNDFNIDSNSSKTRNDIGKNCTISNLTSLLTVADTSTNGQQFSANTTKLNLNVDKGSTTLLLDRLKLYNENLDPETFKSKVGQCVTIKTVKPATKNPLDKAPSVTNYI